MDYPLTRAAALTAAYNAYAVARPDALVEGLEGQVGREESTLLAHTWAGRDLPVREALGVTLGWAALNALALVVDRRRARRPRSAHPWG